MTKSGRRDTPGGDSGHASERNTAASRNAGTSGPLNRNDATERKLEYRVDLAHADPAQLTTGERHIGLSNTPSFDTNTEPTVWSAPQLQDKDANASHAPNLVTLRIGSLSIPAATTAEWRIGATIDCPRQQDDFVDVVVAGQVIARGIPMVWNDRLCIRITERIDKPVRTTPTDAMT